LIRSAACLSAVDQFNALVTMRKAAALIDYVASEMRQMAVLRPGRQLRGLLVKPP
jgi:hypothetical protein